MRTPLHSLIPAVGVVALALPAIVSAMPAADLQKAKDSAQMLARKSAQYELCGVPNANDLRKSLIDFGQRCGAAPGELDVIGKAYDSKRKEQMKALVNGNYVCPVQPAQAQEMIARDLVSIGAVDCQPAKTKLQLR